MLFKGPIDCSFVGQPGATLAKLLRDARATGHATLIGAFTKATGDTVNLVSGEVQGTITMTGANGNQLFGEYAGSIVPGIAPGTFSWALNAQLTGGTGRFISATGKFVLVASGKFVVVEGVFYGSYTETFEATGIRPRLVRNLKRPRENPALAINFSR